MIRTNAKIILASQSQTRQSLLKNSGLEFEVIASNLDEDQIKASYLKNNPIINPQALGLELAIAKAMTISKEHANTYVIGADQVCFMQNQIFDKPGSLENCIQHLKTLRGKEHSQNCCCCIVYNETVIWQFSEKVILKIKDLSDSEIEVYVNQEKPVYACGSYMLENQGKHLFEYIQGDHDCVLGLALIEILNKLYQLKLIEFAD
jgi:septum formation protein